MKIEDDVNKQNSRMSKKKTNMKNIETIKEEIRNLSYEECIVALEEILTNVQDQNISLDKIKTNYIKGNILLKHCEDLLQFAEQEINEINPENLNIN